MVKRRVFYSFHYEEDNWRASQVKQMFTFEDFIPIYPNKWEEIRRKGEKAIQNWIDSNLKGCSCTVVLVGANTAKRKWIDYEIEKSWNDGKGVVGVHIHNLKDKDGRQSEKGDNPFDHFTIDNRKKLSSVVKCYNPPYQNSKIVYDDIKDNLKELIEEAIEIRESL
ncbi:MAG: TIR domain-containing protein [Flavobacteriaceae bacterium]|nr:TIR domain-containing protein [Flavobacteriaceae bacterium]